MLREEDLGQQVICAQCATSYRATDSTVDTVLTRDESVSDDHKPSQAEECHAEWEVGDVLLDLYAVTNVLGEGGMGKVFKVRHLQWDVDLAVKCPKPSLLRNARAMEAFQRECETWVNLGLHPHTVSCYYVRQLGGLPRIFAEYVEGGSLRRWVAKGRLYKDGPEKALERVLRIGMQIGWGLHHAHENGLIHRDVKSGNVLLTRTRVAKVTDFGLASARLKVEALAGGKTEDLLASAGGMTPAYCSPEQFRREKVSQKTDIWSWALCLLEMLVGGVIWKKGPEAPEVLQEAVSKKPRHESLPTVPRELANLLLWCCQEEPQARPTNMAEAVQALRGIYQRVTGRAFEYDRPRRVASRAESLNNRAVSLIDLGKTQEAEQVWLDALHIEPRHTESTFNLGLMRWRQGRLSDEVFVQHMKEVCAIHPGEPLPQTLLAQIHLERGDCESALQVLESCQGLPEAAGPEQELIGAARERLPNSRRGAKTVEAHADAVNAVTLSLNGVYAVTASEDNTLKLWDLASGQCMRTFAGHGDSVESVALSHDGQLVLSGSRDRTVRLWQVRDATCVATMRGPETPVTAVAASHDFRTGASGHQDGTVVLWDLREQVLLDTLEAHEGEVSAVSMSRDGATLVTGGRDGVLGVWDVSTRGRVKVLEGHGNAVRCLALSPRARYALSGSDDHKVVVWDIESAKAVRTLIGHTAPVTGIDFSRDGRLAVSAGADGSVRMWDLSTGCCLRTYRGHVGEVRAVALSRDARFMVSVGVDRTFRVWETGASMKPYMGHLVLCQAVRSETALSSELAFAKAVEGARRCLQAGDWVGAASGIRAARSQPGFRRSAAATEVWSRLYSRLPRTALAGLWEGETLYGHTGAVHALDLSRDGRFALTGSEDNTLKLWEVANGKCLRTYEGHAHFIRSLCISRDASFALSTSGDSTVKCWDVASGECLRTFEERAGNVEAVALSPDDRFAVTGGWTVSLWDVRTGRCLRTFGGHPGGVFSVVWTPDGHFIITGTSEEEIMVWEAATGECLEVLHGHTGVVKSLSMSADGRFLLSGSSPVWGRPGQVLLWDFAAAALVRPFEGHTGAINTVWLSADGRHALSGGMDNTVRLWETETGKCIVALTENVMNPQAVRLSRDGRYVAAANENGSVQIWTLDWRLQERPRREWEESAGPYLDVFLEVQRPYAAEPPAQGPFSDDQVTRCLTRKGSPSWTDADLTRLLATLGCVGYGGLAPETVQEELIRRSRQTVLGWLGSKFGPRRR